jgi:hypothetical protein
MLEVNVIEQVLGSLKGFAWLFVIMAAALLVVGAYPSAVDGISRWTYVGSSYAPAEFRAQRTRAESLAREAARQRGALRNRIGTNEAF